MIICPAITKRFGILVKRTGGIGALEDQIPSRGGEGQVGPAERKDTRVRIDGVAAIALGTIGCNELVTLVCRNGLDESLDLRQS